MVQFQYSKYEIHPWQVSKLNLLALLVVKCRKKHINVGKLDFGAWNKEHMGLLCDVECSLPSVIELVLDELNDYKWPQA